MLLQITVGSGFNGVPGLSVRRVLYACEVASPPCVVLAEDFDAAATLRLGDRWTVSSRLDGIVVDATWARAARIGGGPAAFTWTEGRDQVVMADCLLFRSAATGRIMGAKKSCNDSAASLRASGGAGTDAHVGQKLPGLKAFLTRLRATRKRCNY